MAEKLLIRPKPGLVIKDPRNGNPLPAERNTAVDANQFWLRRLKAGDVYISPAEKKKVSKKKKSEPVEEPKEPAQES